MLGVVVVVVCVAELRYARCGCSCGLRCCATLHCVVVVVVALLRYTVCVCVCGWDCVNPCWMIC